AWRAIAALGAEPLVEGKLQLAQAPAFGLAFNGLDLVAGAFPGAGEAGKPGPSVDQHGAGTTLAAVAALFGAGETERLAQIVEQQHVIGHQRLVLAAVQAEAADVLAGRVHRIAAGHATMDAAAAGTR